MTEVRVYIFESLPNGKVDAYDGRTAEDLTLNDLESMSAIIRKLIDECQP